MSTISSSPSFHRSGAQYQTNTSACSPETAAAPPREAALSQQLEDHLSERLAHLRQRIAPADKNARHDPEGRGRLVDIHA